MKAALWHGRNDVRVETVPDPTPGAEDVVVKVDWCGICGTDLGEYKYGPIYIPVDESHPVTGVKAPVIMGHEFAGEVVEVGRNVSTLSVGDRVGVDTIVSCGHCYWCNRHEHILCPSMGVLGIHGHGGLAEYCVAPSYMCLPLRDGLTPEAAPLAETLSVVVRAIRRGRLQVGETVAVVGAGAVGLMAVQMARHAGAGAVYAVELAELRKQKALELGADVVLDPSDRDVREQILDLTNGIGVDVALECAGGAGTVNLAVDIARPGGRAVLIAFSKHEVSHDFDQLVFTEKEIIGSLSHVYDEDYATAIRLLSDRRILAEPLLSHRISLDDIVEKGFERLAQGAPDALKVIVSPSGLP